MDGREMKVFFKRIYLRFLDSIASFAARRGYDRLFRFAYTQAGSGWFDRNVDNDNGTATRVTALYITYFSDKPLEKLLEALADERYDLVEVLLDNKNFAKNLTAAAVGGIFGRLSEDGLVEQMEFMGNKGFLDLVEVRDRVDVLKAAIVKKEIQSVEYLCSVEGYFAGMGSDDKDMLLDKAVVSRSHDLVQILCSNESFFKGVSDKVGGKAFCMTAARGQSDALKYWYEKEYLTKISDTHIWEAFYRAAANGHLDVVKYWHEAGHLKGINAVHTWIAFYKATANGRLDILKYWHEGNYLKGMSAVHIWTAFYKAAANGHLDIIKYWHKGGYLRDVSDTYIWEAFYKALFHGNLDVVNYVYNIEGSATIIRDHCAEVVGMDKDVLLCNAVDCELRAVVEALCDAKDFLLGVSEKGRVKALAIAIAHRRHDILEYWNNKGYFEGLSPARRGVALYEAVASGSLNVLRELSKVKGYFDGMSFTHIGKAFEQAIQAKRFDILDRLRAVSGFDNMTFASENLQGELGDGNVIERDGAESALDYKGKVLYEAILKGDVEVLKYLHGIKGYFASISTYYKGNILAYYAGKGNINMVRSLKKKGHLDDISAEDRGIAFLNAVASGSLGMVKKLYSLFEGVSVEVRGQALFEAATAGHFSMVKYLYGLFELRDEDLDRALCGAAARGHLDVVRYLYLLLGKLSLESKARVFCEAAAGGHTEVLNFLWEKGYLLSPEDRGRAYYEAKKAGHEGVISYLESLQNNYLDNVSPYYRDLINGNTNIGGLDKAKLLMALFNAAITDPKRKISPIMRPLKAQKLIEKGTDFKTLDGRELHINLAGENLDFSRYDEFNGDGLALEVVRKLREKAEKKSEGELESDEAVILRQRMESFIANANAGVQGSRVVYQCTGSTTYGGTGATISNSAGDKNIVYHDTGDSFPSL
jgi:hypothetical protein